MSRRYKHKNKGGGRQRRISVRAVRRQQPDLRKMSQAIIRLAMEQAAAEAAAQAEAIQPPQDGEPEAEDA